MNLPHSFFNKSSIIVAKELLGQYLHSKIDGREVVGRIVETEAYEGEDDLACHASRGRTKRTETLYHESGHLYIYLNYGIFYLTNVVTGPTDFPSAVLIRSAEIINGKQFALERVGQSKFVKVNQFLATGPGKLSIAFGLNGTLNDLDTSRSDQVFFTPTLEPINPSDIIKSKRIGVDYAGPCKDFLWRFYLKNNPYVSKLN